MMKKVIFVGIAVVVSGIVGWLYGRYRNRHE